MTRSEEEWDKIRRTHRSNMRAPGWPENVRSISLNGLTLVGIDDENRLYWDGHPVEVRRRLDLTFWQKVAAMIVGGAIIVGGIGGALQGIDAGFDFGCKQHWWRSCSPGTEPKVPTVAPQPTPAPQNLTPGTKFQPR